MLKYSIDIAQFSIYAKCYCIHNFQPIFLPTPVTMIKDNKYDYRFFNL